jgi:hypothetical protein
MNHENRVLQRIGARELTQEEVANVTGGIRTLTICTFTSLTGFVGDENGPESC